LTTVLRAIWKAVKAVLTSRNLVKWLVGGFVAGFGANVANATVDGVFNTRAAA
jgi:hypothetical protein